MKIQKKFTNICLFLGCLISFSNQLIGDEFLRRPESLKANAAQTTETKLDDLRIVKRLLESYQRISNNAEKRGNSMWQSFFDDRHTYIHKIFRSGTIEQGAHILHNPVLSDLFYGFDGLASSLLPAFATIDLQNTYAKRCLDHLVRFAEAIGAINLDNPESYGHIPPNPWNADAIIDIISQKLNVPIVFPNPYPAEHGLATSSGIMSYRVPQALYQAYRIKEILKNKTNPRVLEIGAGLGRTAYYARLFGIKDYTIVDLPFTAISSGYFLGVTLGEDQILFSGENASDAQNRIKILTPAEFLAGNKQYDLIINADGFTEFDPNTSQAYWNQIEKSTPIFLSINHEVNPFSVRMLVEKSEWVSEASRFPYWMRKGYIEELVRFKQAP